MILFFSFLLFGVQGLLLTVLSDYSDILRGPDEVLRIKPELTVHKASIPLYYLSSSLIEFLDTTVELVLVPFSSSVIIYSVLIFFFISGVGDQTLLPKPESMPINH